MDETIPQEHRRRRFVIHWGETKIEVYAWYFKNVPDTGEVIFFNGTNEECAIAARGKWDSVVAEP